MMLNFEPSIKKSNMKKLLLNIFTLALSLNAFAQIPTNGLMGYYNFNNSNIRDTSNNERHTYGGFTFGADRNGNSNSAYAGGRCGIQMPTPNGGGLTISCWVNFASYANQTTDYPMIASTGVYIYDNVGNQIGFLSKLTKLTVAKNGLRALPHEFGALYSM